MAKVEGADRVRKALLREKKKYGPAKQSVIVGYTQNYALYVHEMPGKNVGKNVKRRKPSKGVYWGPKGRPKYLEQPFRELSGELAKIVIKTTKKTKNIMTGLLLAGLRLQRESQKIVPVDTGALKSSAFTRKE